VRGPADPDPDPGFGADPFEHLPHVPRIQSGAMMGGLGGRPRARQDRSVLVSSWVRTDRHTATCGGTGGRAAGSPSRPTCCQRRARAYSVRIPASRLSTM
jgi:hypothetical protein